MQIKPLSFLPLIELIELISLFDYHDEFEVLYQLKMQFNVSVCFSLYFLLLWLVVSVCCY